MQHYKKLRVAGQARVAIRAIYLFTRTLPRDEQFGLVRQIRRAVVSIGLNIAEGASRQATKEFLRYLEIARGSGLELEFALQVTEDLEMGNPVGRASAAEELDHTQRELSALINSLRRRLATGTRK
jgi:four helix bundle protein